MVYIQKGQPTLTFKISFNGKIYSSNKTLRSAQIFLLRFSVLNNSWFFTLGNLSLSKDESEEVEAFLLALVFLVMVLG